MASVVDVDMTLQTNIYIMSLKELFSPRGLVGNARFATGHKSPLPAFTILVSWDTRVTRRYLQTSCLSYVPSYGKTTIGDSSGTRWNLAYPIRFHSSGIPVFISTRRETP